MDLKLTDPEANAVKHALEHYLKELKDSKQNPAVSHEEDAVECALQKMRSLSGAPGT
jgi:hypothetical protein